VEEERATLPHAPGEEEEEEEVVLMPLAAAALAPLVV